MECRDGVEEIVCIIVIWVAVGGVLCGGSIRVVERMGHIIKCYLASGDKRTRYSPLSGSYISPTNILIQNKERERQKKTAERK